MYDFSDSTVQITKDEILSKVSELDIFRFYIKSFVELDRSFCSELRLDKNPDCRLYTTQYNTVRYKDFASGDNLDCFNYIMRKFNCTYYEALNIISADFKLSTIKSTISPRLLLSNDDVLLDTNKQNNVKIKSEIQIISQGFKLSDYKYWVGKYGISLDLLNEYNVYSCKSVFLTRGTKRTILNYNNSSPLYAYRFEREGNYYYKIYLPKAEKGTIKWLFNGSSADIEGYDQLPLNGELLIISKSLKDVMVLKTLGYSAISLQGEANKLSSETLDKLYKRFDNIVVFYDNDLAGIKAANSLELQHGLRYTFIDPDTGFKDISDYIEVNGHLKAKMLLKELISI